jgi:hypothetical protein
MWLDLLCWCAFADQLHFPRSLKKLFMYGLGAPSPSLTLQGFLSTLERHLQRDWPSSNASDVVSWFRDAQDGPIGAEARFLTQLLMISGMLETAPRTVAAGGKQSYDLIITAPPQNSSGFPWPPISDVAFHLNFHVFDVIIGTQSFDMFAEMLGGKPYYPTAGDIAAGTGLRKLWMDIVTGNHTSAACPTTERCINVLGNDGRITPMSTNMNSVARGLPLSPQAQLNHNALGRNSLGGIEWWWAN